MGFNVNKELQKSCFNLQECIRTFICSLLVFISLWKFNFLFGVNLNLIDKNNFFLLAGLSICAMFLGFFLLKKALSVGFVLYGLFLSLIVTVGFEGQNYSSLIKLLFLSILLGLAFYALFKQFYINNVEKKQYDSFFLGSLQEWMSALSILIFVPLVISLLISAIFFNVDSERCNQVKKDFFAEVCVDDYSNAYSVKQAEWEKTDAFFEWRKYQKKEEERSLIIYECFSLVFLCLGSVLSVPIIGASFLGLSLICMFKSFIWGGYCNNDFFLFKFFFALVGFAFILYFANCRCLRNK